MFLNYHITDDLFLPRLTLTFVCLFILHQEKDLIKLPRTLFKQPCLTSFIDIGPRR